MRDKCTLTPYDIREILKTTHKGKVKRMGRNQLYRFIASLPFAKKIGGSWYIPARRWWAWYEGDREELVEEAGEGEEVQRSE